MSGVYLTSNKNIALGYAKHRSRSDGVPTVYTVSVSKIKFLDLTDNNTLQEIMDEFLEILKKQIGGKWFVEEVRQKAIDIIKNKEYNIWNIRNITFSQIDLFTSYILSLGVGGVICLEGGEGDINNHDSWIVFDPKNITIIKEEII